MMVGQSFIAAANGRVLCELFDGSGRRQSFLRGGVKMYAKRANLEAAVKAVLQRADGFPAESTGV